MITVHLPAAMVTAYQGTSGITILMVTAAYLIGAALFFGWLRRH